jgi:hypothetical protein
MEQKESRASVNFPLGLIFNPEDEGHMFLRNII